MSVRRCNFEEGYGYLVLNRGAQRRQLFFSDHDDERLENLTFETLERLRLTLFAYELMPNHWHFVVRPQIKQELSEYCQYLAGTHAKRSYDAPGTIGEGHVDQDRSKSFRVESDRHFLSLGRYVERNARQAQLVARAEHWRWSRLWRRLHGRDTQLLSEWHVLRPDDWFAAGQSAVNTAVLGKIAMRDAQRSSASVRRALVRHPRRCPMPYSLPGFTILRQTPLSRGSCLSITMSLGYRDFGSSLGSRGFVVSALWLF